VLTFQLNSDLLANNTSSDEFIPDLLEKMKAPGTSSVVKLAAVEALQVFVGMRFCMRVFLSREVVVCQKDEAY
jgi:hypothetical protein